MMAMPHLASTVAKKIAKGGDEFRPRGFVFGQQVILTLQGNKLRVWNQGGQQAALFTTLFQGV